MKFHQPPAGLATCPHCRLACFTAAALDQHLRFDCVELGRKQTGDVLQDCDGAR